MQIGHRAQNRAGSSGMSSSPAEIPGPARLTLLLHFYEAVTDAGEFRQVHVEEISTLGDGTNW
jgi:hypothetical protein